MFSTLSRYGLRYSPGQNCDLNSLLELYFVMVAPRAKNSLGSRFLPLLWAIPSSHSPVCQEVGIRNIDTSVSTYIKANLSAMEIQNEIVSIQYLFWFSLRYKVHEDTGTVLPWPTRILSSYCNFLDRVNRANQQACLSDLVAHMGPTFSPETRSDHVFVHVSHWTFELVSKTVLSRSTYTQIMFIHVSHSQTQCV